MKKTTENKIRFSRPRLIVTGVLAVITASLYLASMYPHPTYRYFRQGMVFIATAMLVLTLYCGARLFTREIRKELYRRISEAMFNAAEKWRQVRAIIRKKLGLPDKARLTGKDERRIFFKDDEVKTKTKKYKKRSYSDMPDNRRRIRFLWAKYVLDKQSKKTAPTVSQTPDEIRSTLNTGLPDAKLFALYYTARYAPRDRAIDNRDVVETANFVGTGGKI